MSDLFESRLLPKELVLAENEIHVWKASLDHKRPALDRFEATLSSDERARADRFVFQRDRNHFIAGRGILRALLGAYVHRPPGELVFRYGPQGKPALRADMSDPAIRFNLAHSHGLALYAFAAGREIGIDLEHIRPDFAGEDIAERFFSPRELAELRALAPALRAEGFFNCWTRKEAYIKARGKGLRISLDSFDVTLTPGIQERFVRGVDARWHLIAFSAGACYPAALVHDRSRCAVKFFSVNSFQD